MSVRKLLLFLGVGLVIAGMWLAMLWINRVTTPVAQTTRQEQSRPAVLVALHALPTGTLLREGDFGWKELASGQNSPGQLMRGATTETEFLGAITRRDFAEGEPLVASELVKPNDRRFLAAVLRAGRRAVSIFVDAPQTASGLVLPGDYVDVILTQNFGDNIATIAYRAAGETVLRSVRVVAVDRSLGEPVKACAAAADQRVPKTITLEVTEQQAKKLLVAAQLGKLQLAVRPLEGAGAAMLIEEGLQQAPLWASEVSRAIQEINGRETATREAANKSHEKESRMIAARNFLHASSGSTLEGAVRYPPPYASR